MSNLHSSGRGGAGNIVDSSKTPQLQPSDLQTPTLKTHMVTTGRGGTGNFAAGLDAEEKRRRQDVVPVVRRDSHGATHIGRGGTGNVVRTGAAEEAVIPGVTPAGAAPASPTEKEKKEQNNKEQSAAAAPAAEQRKSEEIGWAEKGKNLLFGKK